MDDESRLIDAARREFEAVARDTATPVDTFAGYRVISEIHRGAQGVVYLAIQESTGQKVAIKVMRQGAHAGEVDRARFDREVQILGQLQHPNIVSIHDSGSSAGSFFFVMDYISGQPLDVHMASRAHSVEETLVLFEHICDAVNAAHLSGVIHRDIKPGNLRIDTRGEPHVLDFGLAKVSGDESDAALMTMTGQFVGSLPWSAPEQASGGSARVDTRTDVYALGVILFQMLTGRFPYEVTGNIREVLDTVCNVDPVRPRSLRSDIDDELETIMLMCLAKEPGRRYQTAGELARDVRAYLDGEPIAAKRDSGWYLFKKHVRRHRITVSAAASFLVLVTAGFLVCLAFWQHAESARAEAVAQRQLAVDARAEAEQAWSVAEGARQVAEAAARDERRYSDVMREWMLPFGDDANFFARALPAEAPEPPTAPGDMLLVEWLRQSRDRIGWDFSGDPALGARVRRDVGSAFLDLGAIEDAEVELAYALELSEDAFGSDHPETLLTVLPIARLAFRQGHPEEAERLLVPAVAKMERQIGAAEEPTLAARRFLSECIARQGRLVEACEIDVETHATVLEALGETDERTIEASMKAGLSLNRAGRREQGLVVLKASRDAARLLGAGHPLADATEQVFIKLEGGGFANVEVLGDGTSGGRRFVSEGARFVVDGEAFAVGMAPAPGATDDWGVVLGLLAEGRRTEALPLARIVVTRRQDTLGEQHPATVVAQSRLAWELRAEPESAPEAERLALRSLGTARTLWGSEHVDTLLCQQTLALILHHQGRVQEAAELIADLLPRARTSLAGSELSLWQFERTHAAALREMDQHERAEVVLEEAGQGLLETLGPEDERTRQALLDLVELADALGKPERSRHWKTFLD